MTLRVGDARGGSPPMVTVHDDRTGETVAGLPWLATRTVAVAEAVTGPPTLTYSATPPSLSTSAPAIGARLAEQGFGDAEIADVLAQLAALPAEAPASAGVTPPVRPPAAGFP